MKEEVVKTNEEVAVDILIQVANLAQQKGILTLKEAVVVANAIEVLEKAAKDNYGKNTELVKEDEPIKE